MERAPCQTRRIHLDCDDRLISVTVSSHMWLYALVSSTEFRKLTNRFQSVLLYRHRHRENFRMNVPPPPSRCKCTAIWETATVHLQRAMHALRAGRICVNFVLYSSINMIFSYYSQTHSDTRVTESISEN